MKRLDEHTLPNTPVQLPEFGGRRPVHLFNRESVLAVNTALDCGRPLLVRGEPGTGKSQLARAVAVKLGRVFLSRVVDARTEANELMWSYDALARLADAQAFGASGGDVAEALSRARYIVPGPLWWAFDWCGAHEQARRANASIDAPDALAEQAGVVVLVDEIDKADMAVPNGLLECLGHGSFSVPGIADPVRVHEPPPLVILTTNTDRVLPDAFVRRCVVLHVRVPDAGLVDWLVARGRAHFPELSDTALTRAATQIADDRRRLGSKVFCPPGLAEYIDLLTAATRGGDDAVEERIEQIARFVIHKHIDPGPIDED